MDSLPAGGSSIETIHSGRLTDNRSQSSCTVSVMKLDWESVSESDLTALAASIDIIIATGRIFILTHEVLILLYKRLT